VDQFCQFPALVLEGGQGALFLLLHRLNLAGELLLPLGDGLLEGVALTAQVCVLLLELPDLLAEPAVVKHQFLVLLRDLPQVAPVLQLLRPLQTHQSLALALVGHVHEVNREGGVGQRRLPDAGCDAVRGVDSVGFEVDRHRPAALLGLARSQEDLQLELGALGLDEEL
jgi:hypothetical protein